MVKKDRFSLDGPINRFPKDATITGIIMRNEKKRIKFLLALEKLSSKNKIANVMAGNAGNNTVQWKRKDKTNN